MILDEKLKFSAAQVVTTGSATPPGIASTSWIDLKAASVKPGTGETVYVVCVVTTAFTSSGSDDPLGVYLASDGDVAFASPTANHKLFSIPAVAAIGTIRFAALPPDVALERYVGLLYLSDSGALTAGAVTAYMTLDVQAFHAYADALTIALGTGAGA